MVAGRAKATCITSASEAPSTMKQPGRVGSRRFCGFCFRRGKSGVYFAARQVLRSFSVPDERPLTILWVSSYEKGQEFLRTCKAIGCNVYLLTVEKLRNADWPREAIDEMFFMTEELQLPQLLNAVSDAPRTRKMDRTGENSPGGRIVAMA